MRGIDMKNKKIIGTLLFVCIAILGVGYARISNRVLNLSGTGTFNNDEMNVVIVAGEGWTITDGGRGATATISGVSDDFVFPGVQIKNNEYIDAMVTLKSCSVIADGEHEIVGDMYPCYLVELEYKDGELDGYLPAEDGVTIKGGNTEIIGVEYGSN